MKFSTKNFSRLPSLCLDPSSSKRTVPKQITGYFDLTKPQSAGSKFLLSSFLKNSAYCFALINPKLVRIAFWADVNGQLSLYLNCSSFDSRLLWAIRRTWLYWLLDDRIKKKFKKAGFDLNDLLVTLKKINENEARRIFSNGLMTEIKF